VLTFGNDYQLNDGYFNSTSVGVGGEKKSLFCFVQLKRMFGVNGNDDI
jgi:hypothetical protein